MLLKEVGSTIFYQKKKPNPVSKLSLIALMDIFTILVFFLLLNSGDAEKIHNAKFVALPDSSAGSSPHKEVAIIIGEDKIWFEDELVGEIDALLAPNPGKVIPELSAVLAEYVERKGELSPFEKRSGLSVTILGDKSASYTLIKSIMETCQENNLRNISLAVNQVVKGAYDMQVSGAVSTNSDIGG